MWEIYSATMMEIFVHEDYNPEKMPLEKEHVEFSDQYYGIKTFLLDKVKEFQKPSVLEPRRFVRVFTS